MTENGGDVRAAKRFRTDAVTEVGMRHVHRTLHGLLLNGLKVLFTNSITLGAEQVGLEKF